MWLESRNLVFQVSKGVVMWLENIPSISRFERGRVMVVWLKNSPSVSHFEGGTVM
jgi:hypothetical protein